VGLLVLIRVLLLIRMLVLMLMVMLMVVLQRCRFSICGNATTACVLPQTPPAAMI